MRADLDVAAKALEHVGAIELFVISFGMATLTRYVLRKELMQDIRGLRRELRREEWGG